MYRPRGPRTGGRDTLKSESEDKRQVVHCRQGDEGVDGESEPFQGEQGEVEEQDSELGKAEGCDVDHLVDVVKLYM